jgi:hypothetical protein
MDKSGLETTRVPDDFLNDIAKFPSASKNCLTFTRRIRMVNTVNSHVSLILVGESGDHTFGTL